MIIDKISRNNLKIPIILFYIKQPDEVNLNIIPQRKGPCNALTH